MATLLIAAPAARADRVQVVPGLSVVQEYATNPTGRSRSSDAIADLITRVTPSLQLESAGDAGRAKLQGGVRSRRHWRLTDLNADDPFARLDLDRQITDRLSLFANGDWIDQTNRDPVEDGGDFVQGGRPDLERLNLSGGARYTLGTRTSLTGTYLRSMNDYTATEFSGAQRDYYSDVYSLTLGRIMSPRDNLSAVVRLRDTTFDPIETSSLGSGRGTQDDRQIEVTLGWRRILSPIWVGNVTLGARHLTSEGVQTLGSQPVIENGVLLGFFPAVGIAFDDSSTAFTGGASLMRTSKRTTARLAYNQSTQPTSGRRGSQDSRTLSLSFRRELAKRLSFDLSGSITNQKSASSGGLAINLGDLSGGASECAARGGELIAGQCVIGRSLAEFDSYVTRMDATLRWRLRRRLNAFLGYRYTDYDARGDIGNSYTDQRVRIGLTYFYDIDVP